MVWKPIHAAAIALGLCAASPAYCGEPLTLLAGDTSGVYFPVAIAIGKVLSDGLPERTVQVQVSKGSVANLKLLSEGQGEIAFAEAASIDAAKRGDKAAGFDAPLTDLRIFAALYPDAIQIVASAKSGIRRLSDLKGKRLSVGAAQSGTRFNTRAILDAAGLDDGEIGALKQSSFSEAIAQMKDDKIDATLQSAGIGVASLNELSNTTDIVLIALPRDIVAKLGTPFAAITIPANTYRGQTDAVPTVAVMNYLVTRANLADDHATKLATLMLDRLDDIKEAHPATRNISVQNMALDGPLPMHPGAQKVYRARLKRAEADALNARGEARMAKGERVAALADFTAALRIEPQHAAARDNQKALARIVERDGAMMGIGGKK